MYLSQCSSFFFRCISLLSLCVLCRAYARKKGRNNVTVDDLIHVITPKGRGKWSFLPLDFFFWLQLEFFSQISLYAQKNNSLCVFAWFVFRTMTKPGAKQIDNPWDIMIESFSFCFPFVPWNAHCWAVLHFYFPGRENLLIFVLVPLTLLSIYFACETASAPDSVKAELLQRIRSFLMSTTLR